jgi:ADP-ribosylglycohydrolase
MSKNEVLHWKSARQNSEKVKDRFLGCLLRGAVGNALGAPVEFITWREIEKPLIKEDLVLILDAAGAQLK